MFVVIALLHWKTLLLFITLNTILCEEDIEPGGIVNDEIPPETWDNEEYEDWEQETKDNNETKTDETEDSTWQMSQEEQDSILYDLYEKQPERILEVDEEGFALSDSWIILETDEDDEEEDLDDTQSELLNQDGISKDEDFYEDSDVRSGDLYSEPDSFYHQEDNLECDETVVERKIKRTKPFTKKRNKDEFYFKHKAYGKKKPQKGSTSAKIPNWKKNCCIRGKRFGNGRRTFLSRNIFQECKDRSKNLASQMSRSCKWIFWSCCEARALRRYYIYSQSSQSKLC